MAAMLCICVQVQDTDAAAKLKTAALKLQKVRDEGLLLTVEYTTVFEYLKYLHTIATGIEPWGSSAMLYLAAAVSDFYLPWDEMVTSPILSLINLLCIESQHRSKPLRKKQPSDAML